MSLSAALGIAQQSLLATARQTQVVSRNVTDAANPDYTRRTAIVSSEAPGARVVTIRRAADEALFRANISSISSYESQASLRLGIDQMAQAINGVDNASSAAKSMGALYEALQIFATSPSNATLAANTVEAARQVVRSLNDGTAAVSAQRTSADMEIQLAVGELNSLLGEFEQVNKEIISGTRANQDVNDQLDRRDALLKRIAQYVPVSTFTRDNNDMVITTTSGTMLFETVPRAVTFAPQPGYPPGTVGNPVYVDGVPLPLGTGGNTDASGKIAGLVQLRDSVAPAIQSQLDELARGLITAFAEVDRSGGGGPDLAGLFTWGGGPALPTGGTISTGIAGSIRLNAAVDPGAGGNPLLVRDGGINGAAYVANPSGAGSYADLLIEYTGRLDAPIALDASAGLGSSASVMTASTSAIGWLANLRQQSTFAMETKSALLTQTAEALSNQTGVNVDQEMSRMLELEHSYGASARVIKAVDEMLMTLLSLGN